MALPNIYIVIACWAVKNHDGTTTIIYDDESEKFILDESGDEVVVNNYYDYLKQKNSNPDYIVVKQKLSIISEVNIDELLYKDAMGKLTQAERNTIEQKISE